jgi:outer membrane protein assembly factor BamB
VRYARRNNRVHALDGQTGIRKWMFLTGGWIASSPAIGADGTIYVGSADAKLYAIDGQTGIEKWEFATIWAITSSPAIGSDGTIYVGSSDDKVYAIGP